MPRDMKDKDKSSIVGQECKKPRYFKSEYPNLEKSENKKKFFKTKEKKGLMSMWEDMDDTSFDEEANICLMTDITSE